MSDFQTGSEKFEAKYDVWKNNLLDMSHRNKQLYFKLNAKTLELLHPKMTDLFRELVINGKSISFPEVFEPSFIQKKTSESDEEFQKRLKETHWKRIREKTSIPKRIELITKISDKLLEKNLKNLRRKAKNSIDEQGVNTLYIAFGLLKWFDEDDPKHKKPIYSPLFFIPIKVYRKRVLDPFHIQILDDEVLLNPSLDEKFKAVFNTDLPDFPDEFDLNTFTEEYMKIRDIIIKIPEWAIYERSFIGLFSFSKISMFADIVKHKESLWNHKIIKSIAEGQGFVENPKNIPSETEYTDVAEPQESFHIMDADSSQFKAVTYAKKGASMVIRGPPGTGKSQAISNIIAECLSKGKKVLFVSEKKAALDVVKKRLDRSGIGEFCLELHSQKSNKVEVLKQISRSLGSELELKMYRKAKYKNLRTQRLRLNDYIESIHTSVGDTDSTLFDKVGEYQKFNDLPLVQAEIIRPLEFNDEMLFNIEDSLSQMDVYKNILDDWDLNPWKNINFSHYNENMKDILYEQLRKLFDLTKKIQNSLNEIERKYNLKPIENYENVKDYNDLFMNYNYIALDLDPNNFLNYNNSFAKFFNSNFRNAKNEMQDAIINKKDKKSLFDHAKNIQNFREKYLKEPYIDTFKGIENDIDIIFDRNSKIRELKIKLSPLFENVEDSEYKDMTEWMQNERISQEWLENIGSFDEWCAVQLVLQDLKKYNADEFVRKLINEPILDLDIPLFNLFSKSFAYSWIKAGMGKFSNISGFNPKYHNQIRGKFIKLDDECIKINRYRLAELLFQKRPHQFWMQAGVKSSEFSILSREMAKKRNVKPLRIIIPSCKNFITKIKPCFMMSPLSVSKYLPAEDFIEYFDIVIFDEASQVCPEDSIGAILRAKQLIVVGDEKQLPPTKFFSSNLYDSMDSFQGDTDIFDSILEECTGVGFPVMMLNYHYRSKKEGLIAFSNYHFYENNLSTFPDTLRKGEMKSDSTDIDSLPAIEFNYVKEGVYDKGRTRKNKIEAQMVAEHIIEHYQNNVKNKTSYSLGVVAFSEAQQTAILNALEKLYKQNPDLEITIGEYQDEPLFIKNLENVQGDERDVIMFSIGYGKTKDGKMSLNFGPLNKTGGDRRLNVAITRARYHIKLFCSFLPSEVNLEKTQSAGVHRLIEYLEFARVGVFTKISSEEAINMNLPPSALEISVKKAIENLGYEVDEKIGSSKFQIDLAIVHPDDPSHYILAIECDGGSYYRTKCARDRDRAREQVLKSLGWNFIHIWSPEWFSDSESIIKEIDKLIKKVKKEEKARIPRHIDSSGKSITENAEDAEDIKSKDKELVDVQINVKEFIPEENIKASTKSTEEFRKHYLEFPGVVEYKSFENKNTMSPSDFNRKSSRQKAFKEILKIEGPIKRDLLEKRIKAYFGLKSMTKDNKQKMEEILDINPHINDFYEPPKVEKNLVRIEMIKNKDPRKFDQVSDLELKNAMKLMIKESLSIEKDELFLRTLQLFGFTSRRKEYLPRLKEILDEILDNQYISPNAIRGYDYKPKIKEEETQIAGAESVKSFEELEEIDIEEILAEADDLISPNGRNIEVKTEDIMEILDNHKKYDFDDLIDELDIESELNARQLIGKLKELTDQNKIEKSEKDGDTYWQMK
ncbi:MAG: DUF4011 domain-containing protein [archaeon]|nr:DUF4011 domain-containing protein [archaeon]